MYNRQIELIKKEIRNTYDKKERSKLKKKLRILVKKARKAYKQEKAFGRGSLYGKFK